MIDKRIGKRVKQCRERLGISQEELAEKTGLTANYISTVERGMSFPRCEKLIILLNGLEVSADAIFCDVLEHSTSYKSSELSEKLASLSPQAQKRILQMVELMIQQETQIGDDLQSMQALVGGYIQAVYPFEQPVALVCCESGKLDGLPLNRALRDADGDIYDIVAGNFFIVGLGESDFTDLPHELAEQFAERFRQPEMFMRVDGKIVAAPMPDEQVQGGMSY